MTRPLTFERAKALYVHRYTMEHVPAWALVPVVDPTSLGKRYYAPQFRSDMEWYENTLFKGESELADNRHCHTSGQTWPLGHWLRAPYQRGQR